MMPLCWNNGAANWRDLVEFELVPVRPSTEAADIIARQL